MRNVCKCVCEMWCVVCVFDYIEVLYVDDDVCMSWFRKWVMDDVLMKWSNVCVLW